MNMKRFMNKKVVAIGLAAGITLGGAGAAFAYFTSTGNGTGSATVGCGNVERHANRLDRSLAVPRRRHGGANVRLSPTRSRTRTGVAFGPQPVVISVVNSTDG